MEQLSFVMGIRLSRVLLLSLLLVVLAGPSVRTVSFSTKADFGTVNYTVAANTGSVRMGTTASAGIMSTFPRNSMCSVMLMPTYQSFAGGVGGGTVTVTMMDQTCEWSASTSPFVHIVSGSSGTGNGEVGYTVEENTGMTNRSKTITIDGETFTVYQGKKFLDVPAGPCYDDIGKLSARGVTVGYPDQTYHPDIPVTRGEMAALILRAKGDFNPDPTGGPVFDDVPGGTMPHLFYNFIENIVSRGIVTGCSPGPPMRYCPNDPVTRGQMAAYIVRALDEFNPPVPATQRFKDVPPSYVFYTFIDRLAALNITVGCSPDHLLYCPNDPVTRCQMASFLVRAFHL